VSYGQRGEADGLGVEAGYPAAARCEFQVTTEGAMTLIFCVVNEENAVLVADRRLSFGQNVPPDDESSKASVINLADARLAVAFTGLAEIPAFAGKPKFYTRRWVADALIEAATPSPLLQPTMYRFREIASRDIEQLPIRPQDRRLTVVAVGYEYSADDARPWYFRVSNFEGKGPISKPQLHPKDSFDLLWARAQRPPVSPTVSATAAGWTLGNTNGFGTRACAVRASQQTAVDLGR
jgi:hypothetical protein